MMRVLKLVAGLCVIGALSLGGAYTAQAAGDPQPGDGQTIQVQPDGGVTTNGTSQCGSKAYAYPSGSWGPVSKATCALLGGSNAKAYYSWWVVEGSNTKVCAQGVGYATSSNKAWWGLGCGKAVYDTQVLWNNVSDYQQLQVRSTTGTGGGVQWR